MLYRTIKKLIELYKENEMAAELADLMNKIDVFYAASKLTDEEYKELTA